MEIIKKIIAFFKSFFTKTKKVAVENFIPSQIKVVKGELIVVCPGGRHAWYQSNVGIIRKPYKLI